MSGSSRPAPPALRQLVGRARECALLRERLAAACAGRGSVVLIGGEAGIGKTALAEKICAEAADQGALVLVGRCYDLTETPPYGPWREALALAPTVGDLLLPAALAPTDSGGAAATSQEMIAASLRAYLAAITAGQPAILLLDDLHWADPASLDLLRLQARGGATLPLLIIATYRTNDLARESWLYQLLPLLVRESGATQLELGPLDHDDLRALIRARYGLSDWDEGRLLAHLSERAQGNSFFAGEILRTLEETGLLYQREAGWGLGPLAGVQIPLLVRQVIEGRLARLGAETERHLAMAAVIGQEIPVDIWVTVAGVDEETLLATVERGIEAHLLAASGAGGGLRFVHALVREVLYAGLAPPRRVAWQRRVAEALLAATSPDPDAVAYHLRQAGDRRAFTWLIRAGERAQRGYAWFTAADRYEAALALPEGAEGDPRERALLLMTMAQLRRYVHPQLGVGYLEEAEQLALSARDPVLAAAARFDRGHLRQIARGDHLRGLEEMRAALPLLEDAPETLLRQLPALIVLSIAPGESYHRGALLRWLVQTGHLAEARVHAAILADGAAVPTARGLTGMGVLYGLLGQPAAAQRALAAGAQVFRNTGQHHEAATAMAYALYFLLFYQGDDLRERQRLVDEIGDSFQRSVGVSDVSFAFRTRTIVLFVEGAWAELRQIAHIIGERKARIVKVGVGMMARAQGDRELAWAEVRRQVPLGPAAQLGTENHDHLQEHQRLAALLSLDEGDLTTARAWLEAHDRWLAWSGAVLGQSEGQQAWVEYHRAAGDRGQAYVHAERALARASEPRQPLALLAAHRLLGELETGSGRSAEAAAHLGAALALAEACAAPYERALTLLALAELGAANGEHERARMRLDEARALLLPLEAQPALARAADLAARLAVSAPAPVVYPSGLSAREVEVLRLVAQGLTNPQVAERLFLSRRTVDQHLRSIYGKIGVENRTAAARWAVGQAIVGDES